MMVLPQTRKTSRVLDFAGNLETYFGKLFGMQPSNKAEAVCYSMATGIIDNLHSEHLSPWSREKCDIVTGVTPVEWHSGGGSEDDGEGSLWSGGDPQPGVRKGKPLMFVQFQSAKAAKSFQWSSPGVPCLRWQWWPLSGNLASQQ